MYAACTHPTLPSSGPPRPSPRSEGAFPGGHPLLADEEAEQNQENPITAEIDESEEYSGAQDPQQQQYYGESAGKTIDEVIEEQQPEIDDHGNPIGTQYDLPRDETMMEYTVLMMWFIDPSNEGSGYDKVVESLRAKGFNVVVHNYAKGSTIQQMMVSLLSAQVAWVISGDSVDSSCDMPALVRALKAFHHRGGGLMIWGDNHPYFAHANVVLDGLFPGEAIRLTGDDQGDQIMKATCIGDGTQPGQFRSSHIVMTGIKSLYEGVTISYVPDTGPLKILATYNSRPGDYEGRPYCLVADKEVYAKMAETGGVGRGRVIIDGGFTKLLDIFWDKTAGTDRYIKNACTWLLNIGSRLASDNS